MTKDEVMLLALEALIVADKQIIAGGLASDARLQMKKAIAAIRQVLKQPSDIEAAVRAENEACAEIAYRMAYSEDEAEEIAKAIRARVK